PEAVAGRSLLRLLGRSPQMVERFGLHWFSRKASIVYSNMRGPSSPLSILGSRIRRLMFWVPQAGHLSVGVSVLSYMGHVTLGVMADANAIAQPRELVL